MFSISNLNKGLQRRIIWHLYRVGPRQPGLNGPHVGWPVLVGVFLIIVLGVIYFVLIEPQDRQLKEMQQMVKALSLQKPGHATPSTLLVPLSPADQLMAFYQSFPDQHSLYDALGTLHQLASQNQIALPQGDYRLAKIRDSKLLRYEVNLPLKGDYLHIRSFLAAVLAEMPNVALDAVNFTRPKVGEPEVETQIHLSIYTHGP